MFDIIPTTYFVEERLHAKDLSKTFGKSPPYAIAVL